MYSKTVLPHYSRGVLQKTSVQKWKFNNGNILLIGI